MTRDRTWAVTLAALLAGVLAGCGAKADGLTKEEYISAVSSIVAEMNGAFERSFETDPVGRSESARLTERLSKLLNTLSDRIAALDAPSDIEASQAKLAHGIHTFAGTLHDLSGRVRTSSDAELEIIMQHLDDPETWPGAREILDALAELKAKGYYTPSS